MKPQNSSHFEKASKKAEQTARDTFQGKGLGLNLPEIKIKLSDIKKGVDILDLLSNNNILPSKSEARRAIANKGIKINNILVLDEKMIISLKDFKNESLKISHGKRNIT